MARLYKILHILPSQKTGLFNVERYPNWIGDLFKLLGSKK